MKVCTKCQQTKLFSEFHVRNSVKSGLDAWCKSCKSVYRKTYFSKNTEKEKRRARIKAWRQIGIVNFSYENYEALLKAQNNACKICGYVSDSLDVDHCHETGKVRGLLCGFCNKGLGMFKDSKELLEKAIKYL